MSLVTARHRPTERLPEIRALLDLCCGQGELVFAEERIWASATFTGVRHTVALRFAGEAVAYAEALIELLPNHDFALAGKLVADAAIVCVDRKRQPEIETLVTIELLILDER